MALKDKLKWDEKYKNTPKLLEDRNPSEKLILAMNKTKGNKALDIACGAGKNSIYLAKNSFFVDSLDISEVALNSLKNKKLENITTFLVDLDEYTPLENSYDFIVKTNFLDRNLIPKLKNTLKKDGILYMETYMNHKINEKPSSNPDFLLQKDELKTFFDNSFEIIDYDEFENDSDELYKMMKQSIIVKKK